MKTTAFKHSALMNLSRLGQAWWIRLISLTAIAWLSLVPAAQAASGSYATVGAGNYAQSLWWLDFGGSTSGSFSFTLPGGAGTLSTSVTSSSGMSNVGEPAWSGGGAFGHGAYNGITGSPIFYWISQSGIGTVTLSSLAMKDTSGNARTFALYAADGENTDPPETIVYTSNSTWQLLDTVTYFSGYNGAPVVLTGVGTNTVTENAPASGDNNYNGSVILGTQNPTQVSATFSGNEAALFAVALPPVTLTLTIAGRINAADQFTAATGYTSPAASLKTQNTTGIGTTATTGAISIIGSNSITLSAAMASGSVSSLSNYTSTIACTNSGVAGSTTTLPSGAGTSFAFTPNAGASVACTITLTPIAAKVNLVKIWASGSTKNDKITVTTTGGSANPTVSSTAAAAGNTTTGTAVTVAAGNTITFPAEIFNTGSQSNYSTTLACTGNTNPLSGSAPGSTLLIDPGDAAIVCTYTNTPAVVNLTLVKTWGTNSKVGDTVTVTSTGGTNTASVTSKNLVSTGTTTTGTAVKVAAGNVITVGEVYSVGSASNYTSTLACTGNANPISGSVLTVNASDTAIICTETNTPNGTPLTVRVFGDTGGGAGVANDGVQNGAEAGLASVNVTASVGGTVVASATTDASGSAVLMLPVGTSGTVVVSPSAPSGYAATGGSAGTTGGSYNRPSVSFTYAFGNSYTGVSFGLVPPNTLITIGAQTLQPGTTTYYPHTFMAGSAGQVSFSTSAIASPAMAGWTEIVYRDSSCSGAISAGDPQITGPIAATAGQQICILVKESVPAGAPLGAQNKVTTSASFTYSGSAAPAASVLTQTDTTTVGVGDLKLVKLVQNLTLGSGYGNSNAASPGNTLQYQLTIQNLGNTALSTVVVNDATPAFTSFVSAACPSASLPASLSACSVSVQPAVGGEGALQWKFTGSLAPGSQAAVTFQVQVAQ